MWVSVNVLVLCVVFMFTAVVRAEQTARRPLQDVGLVWECVRESGKVQSADVLALVQFSWRDDDVLNAPLSRRVIAEKTSYTSELSSLREIFLCLPKWTHFGSAQYVEFQLEYLLHVHISLTYIDEGSLKSSTIIDMRLASALKWLLICVITTAIESDKTEAKHLCLSRCVNVMRSRRGWRIKIHEQETSRLTPKYTDMIRIAESIRTHTSVRWGPSSALGTRRKWCESKYHGHLINVLVK